MQYSLQMQAGDVGDSMRARFAMAIPVLSGMLFSTNRDMIAALGGYNRITLEQFLRIYKEHPGDYGICFEYAVHRAISTRDRTVYPLISNVLEDFCGIRGGADSILFGAEKTGATSIVSSAKDLLTDESLVLAGAALPPLKLRERLEQIVQAFRSAPARQLLPPSIRGIWKADLFVGSAGPDRWVATSLKVNRRDLHAAEGLLIGMYPEERRGKGPEKDAGSNLILCPLPYSSEFMQLFGATFQIIKQLVASNGRKPSPVALVYEDDQEVAKWLSDRRRFPLMDVLDALEAIKQPDLLTLDEVIETIWRSIRAGRGIPDSLWAAYVALAPISRS